MAESAWDFLRMCVAGAASLIHILVRFDADESVSWIFNILEGVSRDLERMSAAEGIPTRKRA